MLRHESDFALVEGLHGDEVGSECPVISDLDKIWLCMGTIEEL